MSSENIENQLRDVDSSEFFYNNMSMVGFDNSSRALVMAVKEAVDNALDASEDLNILPEITLELWDDDERDRVVWMRVKDNASGIPEEEIESVFGDTLYSSRFGREVQSRGQQGIGISAAVLWSQKHLGERTKVTTKQPEDEEATRVEISVENKGKDVVASEWEKVEWDQDHGTEVLMPIKATWRSRQHLEEYLQGTALANPSAKITYIRNGDDPIVFERVTEEMPDPPQEMKPLPDSADIGTLEQLIKQSNSNTLKPFLESEFTKVSSRSAKRVCRKAGVDEDNPFILSKEEKEAVARELRSLRTRKPDDRAIAPLGEDLIRKALESQNPDFIGTCSKEMFIVNGHPTVVETGIAYGGDIDPGTEVEYYRVANKVPLVYDSANCGLKKGVESVDWTRYSLDQSASGDPIGPAVMFVHICSTQVPFGNEAKTYVADEPKIIEEIKLSLQQCAREFSRYVKKQQNREKQKTKVEKMIPIYQSMTQKLGTVSKQKSEDICSTVAQACSTVVIDEEGKEVWNPTESNRNVTIDGEEVKLSPGERQTYEEECEYFFRPVYRSEVKV